MEIRGVVGTTVSSNLPALLPPLLLEMSEDKHKSQGGAVIIEQATSSLESSCSSLLSYPQSESNDMEAKSCCPQVDDSCCDHTNSHHPQQQQQQQLSLVLEDDDSMRFGSHNEATGALWMQHVVDHATGLILWANAAELQLLRYTATEYVGRPLSDFHVDPALAARILATLCAGQPLHQVVAPLRAKDGHVEYVQLNSEKRTSSSGSSSQQLADGSAVVDKASTGTSTTVQTTTTRIFSTCVTDSVLRQQAELKVVALEQQVVRLQVESRRKTDYLRRLLHELRNPLSGVAGNLDLLLLELMQATNTTTTTAVDEQEVPATATSVDEQEIQATATRVDEQETQQQLEVPPSSTAQGNNDDDIDDNKLSFVQQRLHAALDHTQQAHQAAEHLMLVINNTLSLSRLEWTDEHEFDFTPKPFSVCDLLQNVKAILNVKAQEKNILLQVELMKHDNDDDSMEATFVKTDMVWIKQVIINLLSNSLKFTEPNGRVLVRVGVLQQQQQQDNDKSNLRDSSTVLEITVQDTGIGMTADEQGKLFGLFSQANETIATQFGGSGLGLHIVKQLLDHIGGTIRVQSEKGTGSTFVVTVPCESLTAEECASLAPSKSKRLASSSPPPPPLLLPATRGKRVLVVDDCRINQNILASYLEKRGYTPELAENGQIALDLHKKFPFDIILTDIDMPVMDGKEMTRTLRQHEYESNSCSPVPVIGISGNVLPEDVISARVVGINEYLGKPFKFHELDALMVKYLE